ncbi:hypothetical protein WJX72_010303 [[Myrmecia] bisecta]|uniref:2-phytyl-1,4-beta-naphthoquinone methyltransferase, chloroplastic n=1 Tax=[Myrmecia] bisecta TaxID=41462 RepID=A0AAW1RA15_9CHLO
MASTYIARKQADSICKPPSYPQLTFRSLRLLACKVAQGQQNIGGPAKAFTKGQEGAARQQLFNKIAPVYDQLNDTLSLGLHRVWKRMTVKWSGAGHGSSVLDVCCGSGDLAFRLSEAVGSSGQVVGLDFAQDMLDDAARRESGRYASRSGVARIQWVQGDAMQLPFADNSFDAATMGYGLRNVSNILKALSELKRVLKPSARVAILDFNNSTDPTTDAIQGWALANVVVPVATSFGLAAEYEYLRPSIQQFPTGREQEALARQAGFAQATHYEIGFGLMGCLVATK